MKYVLIVENDDTCYFCPLCDVEFGWLGDVHKGICRVNGEDVTVYLDGVSGRPKWCPLKPLPEKRENLGTAYSVAHTNGWNDCIEEIEK